MAQRHRYLAAALSLGLCWAAAPAMAAQNLVFVSGAFRRSIPVSDLEHLAATGQPRGLLSDVLRFSNQNPEEASKLLNTSIQLPIALVSRLLNTRIGEALLDRLARIVYPLKAYEVGLPALRSAVVMGIAEGKDGALSPISFLQAYPNDELEVNLPALMTLMRQANSIADLVSFFSESPLDGLRGEMEAPTDPDGNSSPAPLSEP